MWLVVQQVVPPSQPGAISWHLLPCSLVLEQTVFTLSDAKGFSPLAACI